MQQPLWTPSAERIAASRMDAFRRFINDRHALHLADYPALHALSVEQRKPSGRPSSISSRSTSTRPPNVYYAKARQCPMRSGFPVPP